MSALSMAPEDAGRELGSPSVAALATALNAALLRAGSTTRVRSLQIVSTRLSPRRKLVIGALAECDDPDGRYFQRIGMRFFQPGLSGARHEKALLENPRPARAGPGVLHLLSLGGVAWLFPNDRKIRGAAALADIGEFNAAAAPQINDALRTSGIRASRIEILRYVPEQSCTARIALGGAIYTLIGKCASDNRGVRGLAALLCARRISKTLCPAPIAYVEQAHLAIQELIAGAPLPPEEFLNPDSAATRSAMRRLAELHRARAPDILPLVDFGGEREAAIEKLAGFESLAAERALKLLSDHAAPSPSAARGLLHGDLHFGNVLFEGDRAALIDFDAAQAGPPEYDVGGFLAAMMAHAVFIGLDDETLRRAVAGAISAYRDASGETLSRDLLAWRVGEALITERVARSLTRMKTRPAGSLQALVDMAARAFNGEMTESAP